MKYFFKCTCTSSQDTCHPVILCPLPHPVALFVFVHRPDSLCRMGWLCLFRVWVFGVVPSCCLFALALTKLARMAGCGWRGCRVDCLAICSFTLTVSWLIFLGGAIQICREFLYPQPVDCSSQLNWPLAFTVILWNSVCFEVKNNYLTKLTHVCLLEGAQLHLIPHFRSIYCFTNACWIF